MTADLRRVAARLLPPLADLPWQKRSRCRPGNPEDILPEVFFSQGMGTEAAKKVCRECPVVDECREWALSIPSQKGVAGALSEADRARVRRKRQRAARAALRASEAAS